MREEGEAKHRPEGEVTKMTEGAKWIDKVATVLGFPTVAFQPPYGMSKLAQVDSSSTYEMALYEWSEGKREFGLLMLRRADLDTCNIAFFDRTRRGTHVSVEAIRHGVIQGIRIDYHHNTAEFLSANELTEGEEVLLRLSKPKDDEL